MTGDVVVGWTVVDDDGDDDERDEKDEKVVSHVNIYGHVQEAVVVKVELNPLVYYNVVGVVGNGDESEVEFVNSDYCY